MAILDSLLVNLGFVVETKGLRKFQHSVAGVRKDLIEFGIAAVAIGATIFEGAKKFAESSDELEIGAERAGLTTTAYQELAGAAELAGIKQTALTSALQAFNNNIGQASLGAGSGIKAFAMLGVSIRDVGGNIKSTQVLLNEVAEKLQNFGQARRASIAQQLGFTSESVRFLMVGKKVIDDLRQSVRETGVVINEDAIKSGAKLSENLALLGLRFRGIKTSIQESFLKPLSGLVKELQLWIKANREIIQQDLKRFFKDLGLALHVVIVGFKFLVSVLSTVAKPLGGIINLFEIFLAVVVGKKIAEIGFGFISLAKSISTAAIAFAELDFVTEIGAITTAIKSMAMAAITLDAALLPFEIAPIAIAAAFVALGLAVQDVIVFFQGGASITGELVEKFPILGDALDGVKTAFIATTAVAKFLFKSLKFIFNLLTTNPFKTFMKGFNAIKDSKIVRTIESKFVTTGSEPSIKNSALNIIGKNPALGLSSNFKNSFAPISGSSANSTASTVNNNNNNSTANVTINVSDSNNSQKTAEIIQAHINNVARQAQRNFQNPVVG